VRGFAEFRNPARRLSSAAIGMVCARAKWILGVWVSGGGEFVLDSRPFPPPFFCLMTPPDAGAGFSSAMVDRFWF